MIGTGFAHVSCGNCRTMLMYPYGAPSVKCAVCHFVTNVNVSIFILCICLPHMPFSFIDTVSEGAERYCLFK